MFSKFKKMKNNINLICAANVICHIPDLKDLIKSLDFLLSKKRPFYFLKNLTLVAMFKKVFL